MKYLIISSFVFEFRVGSDVDIARTGIPCFLLFIRKIVAVRYNLSFLFNKFLCHFLQIIAVDFCEVS